MNKQPAQKNINKQLRILLFVVVGMFGFCFALVPLYNVFCSVTGLNGKTTNHAINEAPKIDESRLITVELISTLNESIPDSKGEFSTKIHKFKIHPGELIHTTFWVKNLTALPVVVQAIPSVSPGKAAKHFKKVECFCFQHQPLAALEGKDMPLVFTVSPDLPKDVETVTLAYTLFNIS